MTIIVDANATHRLTNGDVEGRYILGLILASKLVYVTGGKHKTEILDAGFKKSLYRQLILAGKIREYTSTDCQNCEQQIVSHLSLLSDDPHIIALAIRSGCRILYSFDENLCKDFKSKQVIDQPRGKIFHSKKKSQHLLRKVRPPA